MKSTRHNYIDALRGFAILMVVIQHIYDFTYKAEFVPVATIHNAIFFFIAGLLAHKDVDRPVTTITRGILPRVRMLIIPAFIFFFLYDLAHNVAPIPHMKELGLAKYWFTPSLFLMFVAYWITWFVAHKLRSKAVIGIGMILVSFLGILYTAWAAQANYFNPILSHAPSYMMFFAMGVLCRAYSLIERISNSPMATACIVGLFIASFCYSFLFTTLNESQPHVIYMVTHGIILFICWVLTFFLLFQRHQNFFNSENIIARALTFTGKRTLDIYFIHYFFVPMPPSFPVSGQLTIDLTMAVGLAIPTVALSLLTSEIIRLSPVLASVLLGVREPEFNAQPIYEAMQYPPLLSVVVPCYNSGKYLSKCLNSILQSSFSQIELITVYNPSTDDTLATLERFAAGDPRVKIVHNTGVLPPTPSRLEGIKQAQGEYILFVDHDDWISQDHILRMYEAISSNGCDIVCANGYYNVFRRIPFSRKATSLNNVSLLNRVITGDELRESILLNYFTPYTQFAIMPWLNIFSRKLFTEHTIEPNDLIAFEDAALQAQLFHAASSVSFIEHRGVYHRQGGSSGLQHHKRSLDHGKELYRIMMRYVAEWHLPDRFADHTRAHLADIICCYAVSVLLAGNKESEARQLIVEALNDSIIDDLSPLTSGDANHLTSDVYTAVTQRKVDAIIAIAHRWIPHMTAHRIIQRIMN